MGEIVNTQTSEYSPSLPPNMMLPPLMNIPFSATFVPVSGEPGRFPFDSISPTQAAERLATAFGTQWLSLNGVAARIPKSLAGKADVIRQFVLGYKDYEAILGGPTPIIGKASLILSGIGNARSSRDDAWFKETAHLEDISDVQKIAAGNIGGVWIPERDEYEQRIKEINERSLGIQRAHFERCAHAGTRSGLGVVVLALEPEKARIIKRAIGLINHLIIGESLADAILDESTTQAGDVRPMPTRIGMTARRATPRSLRLAPS